MTAGFPDPSGARDGAGRYLADPGTGDAARTGQVRLGVGNRLGWGNVTPAWRALGHELDENDMELTFDGPALGVGFCG
jgi:hypothetical protein